MSHYVLNDEGVPVPVELAEALLALVRNEWNGISRHVATTRRGRVLVSTVFLMVGEAPFLWETMILGGPLDGYQERSRTMEESLSKHHTAVQKAFPKKPPKTVWGDVPGLNSDGTIGVKKVAEVVGVSRWVRLLRDDDLV